MTRPRLSILIDTYNHERYIEQAIVSALEQDFPPSEYEILVVDDGSIDRTPEIVRKFGSRVRLLRKKNGGQASAFNVGFQALQGEVIAFLDGDDWFAPGKLEAVMNALDQHPEVAAIGHGYFEFNDESGQTKVVVPSGPLSLNLTTPEAAREAYFNWRFLLMGALTVRRRVCERVMPIPDALVFSADSPIATASMLMGVRLLREPLCYYRLHSANCFAVTSKDTARLRRKYDIDETMFGLLHRMLLRFGVASDIVSALLDGGWVYSRRMKLGILGGSSVDTFRTEMRAFRWEYKKPTAVYALFKYILVGAMALLIPPRRFYKLRDWYGRRNLSLYRNLFCKAPE